MSKVSKIYTSLNEDELLWMSSITYKSTGIKNVVLWIGHTATKEKAIKVSNVLCPSFDGKDCFTLTIPDFKIIGKVNKELITDDVLQQIKEFVMKNLDNILEHSDFKTSSCEMIENLKSI